MRVELNVPESVTEPRLWLHHKPVLFMALRTGSIELGLRRSAMTRHTLGAGEMCLVPRHFETWAEISYNFDELSAGGRVRITTTNPAALKAIHEFFGFKSKTATPGTGLGFHEMSYCLKR